MWAFCTFGEQEPLSVAVCGLLTEVALLLWTVGSSCGSTLTMEEGFPRPPDTKSKCRSWGAAREPGLAAWEGAEGSQVSPPCLHQVGLTLTVLRMMTTGHCLVEDERGSAEEAWLRGGQKGTQALGGWSTNGPGCPAGGGRASRAGQGRGWSLGGALNGRDRTSTSGRGMAVGGASNTPWTDDLT